MTNISDSGEAISPENIDQSSKLDAILNTVVDGIITINSKGIVQSFNPSAVRIFGYQPEEVIGQNVKMLMPDPYHTEHDTYIKNHLDSGVKKIIGIGREVSAKRKDGSIFPMELGVGRMNVSGEPMFVGTIRDITDRKMAEQALKDNQAKLQAIVDNTVDGLITIDERGVVETFNKACEEIFGFKADEVIGKNVKMLMPSPYQSEHDGYLANYHRTGNRQIIGIGREVEGLRKDGSTFPLDLSVSEVNILGRKVYSGIVRDISQRKQAEETIRQANAELEEFSYRTSHDLRAPLVSALRLLDMTAEAIKNGDTDRALQSIEFVKKSLTKLVSLVKDILSLTKVKHEDEPEESVDVEACVKEALENLTNIENFQRLHIQTDIAAKRLLTKKSRFVLILENLLSNAVKYQDPNKTASFVQINTRKTERRFELEIIDNGLGIPKDSRQNLFKMFMRFHPRVSFGSGLGMYMVKKSADLLRAELKLEDDETQTHFRLSFPLEKMSKGK